jgi:hypothetical protein
MLLPNAEFGGASPVVAGASPGGAASNSAGAAGLATGAAGAPSAGAAGGTSLGGANSGGANSGGANSGGANSGGANSGGTNSGGANNGGTNSGGANNGGANNGGANNGGANNGGASNGGAPAAGSAGAGQAGAGGSAGGTAIEQLLSQDKPATADSEQTGHLAALGNDGATDTRWCAANGAAGHYWQVDLGQSYTLSKLDIGWEQAAAYQFKVDGSLDGTTWTTLLDQTASTNAEASQTYPLSGGPSARYVRITTTTLPTTSIWASFFEFKVYGH